MARKSQLPKRGPGGPDQSITMHQVIYKLSEELQLNKVVVRKILMELQLLCLREVVKTGQFIIPGIVKLYLHHSKPIRAHIKNVFGTEIYTYGRGPKRMIKATPIPAIREAVVGRSWHRCGI